MALPFQIDHETKQALKTAELSGLQIGNVPIHPTLGRDRVTLTILQATQGRRTPLFDT